MVAASLVTTAAEDPRGRRLASVPGWVWGVLVGVAMLAWRWPELTGSTTVLVQATLSGLLLGAVYGLIAIGLTLIFGVLEIVNFAHGALLTLGMYLGFVLVDATGVNPYVGLLVVVPALFLVGVVIQAGVLNRAMGQPIENQLLLTFGLALLLQNGLLLTFGATPRRVGVDLGAPLRVLGAVATLPRVIAFAAALLIAAGLFWLLRRTRLGTAIRAVGQNPTGAALVGIDARRIYLVTYGLGAATVGAAAVLVLPFLQLEPVTGESFTIIAFVIVVLGGLGDVRGALVGGILVGLTQQIGGVAFPGQDNLLPVFVLFIATLFLRPEGLFGRRLT